MLRRVNQMTEKRCLRKHPNLHYERVCRETANHCQRASLLRPSDVDIERQHGGPGTAYDFAGPERGAEQRYPAVFRLAHGTEKVAIVGELVCVDASPREVAFQRRIRIL